MPYTPFRIQLYDALYAMIAAGFSAELEAIGYAPLAPTAFEPRHPALLRQETVAFLYVATAREAQGKHWVETGYHFELQLFVFGVAAIDLQHRLMAFEFAAEQVLAKDRTVGGLLTTLKVGNSEPAPMIAHNELSQVCDGVVLPVVCQPATRIAVPEYAP